MRNIARIPHVCNKIADLWINNCPDWRFMQFINNFMRWLGSDGFYLEDDKLIEMMELFIKELNKNGSR